MNNLDGPLSPALLHMILSAEPPEDVIVGTCSLAVLFSFKTAYTLAIPEYQRPYVWQLEQVEKLLQDLNDFTPCGVSSSGIDGSHYLGTILLHRKGDIYNLIDGQQRITTLLLINAALQPEASLIERYAEQLALFYEAPVSKVNIARNYQFLQEKVYRYLDREKAKALFDYLTLTVIVTNSADDAFNFFVSQNNRGVSLGATDFLKSFHLRVLRERPDLQRVLAKGFDKSNYGKFLDGLFAAVLWRGRNWRGKEVAYDEPGEIRQEFEEGSLKGDESLLAFYPGRANPLAGLWSGGNEAISVKTQSNVSEYSELTLPFSLRQPVEEGAGFFLYTGKYVRLFHHLFDTKHPEGSPVAMVQEFYHDVYQNAGMNSYLKSLFRLCLVLFADQFGERELYPCALWLDYFLGAYRVSQKSIVAQTSVKICRDRAQNILDIITSSYVPGEVFRFLKNNTSAESYKTSLTDTSTGVQANYVCWLRKYYGKKDTDQLTDKKDWIDDRLHP